MLSEIWKPHRREARAPYTLMTLVAVIAIPRAAFASGFDAMADFVALAGMVLIYLVILVVLGTICVVTGRRQAATHSRKRRVARGSLIGTLGVASTMFVATVINARPHGPMDETILLASGVAAMSIPSLLIAWGLLRRNPKPEG